MDATDTLLAVTTLSFDIAALELFLPLCVGGQLVIASREVAADPVQLMERLERHKVTVMQATPITWRMLLDAGWDGHPLKKILCGGEALPQELADRLLKLSTMSMATLWNMYGPTETTIWSATSQVKPGARIAIGPPIDNTQFYIVDSRHQQQPIGVPGELCIAGDGVARGYHKRPELTAERFVVNPFSAGARMYKTGDLARYRPDGTVEFLGRLDHQIKLRGYRIELGEIESVLAKHADVGQAVAIVREDAPGDQRLVAYVVAKNGTMPGPAELRKFASETLPDYMVPSIFMGLASLPLTANGKIDRKALPQPGIQAALPDKNFVAASTSLEKTLAEIWSDVLKVPQVGVEDSILELGADSIHIFQITARANEAGIDMTAKQLLQARTITKLCSTLGEQRPASPARPRITRASREAYRAEVTPRR
jgi:acyl-coenzyme A synthetase/AMP-(fatty) acid ligase/aryl carrier-like protein